MNDKPKRQVENPAFQARVKAWRQANGLSLMDAAAAVGVTVTTVWRWERYGKAPRSRNDRERLERAMGGTTTTEVQP